jgi:hypothetical protein
MRGLQKMLQRGGRAALRSDELFAGHESVIEECGEILRRVREEVLTMAG